MEVLISFRCLPGWLPPDPLTLAGAWWGRAVGTPWAHLRRAAWSTARRGQGQTELLVPAAPSRYPSRGGLPALPARSCRRTPRARGRVPRGACSVPPSCAAASGVGARLHAGVNGCSRRLPALRYGHGLRVLTAEETSSPKTCFTPRMQPREGRMAWRRAGARLTTGWTLLRDLRPPLGYSTTKIKRPNSVTQM